MRKNIPGKRSKELYVESNYELCSSCILGRISANNPGTLVATGRLGTDIRYNHEVLCHLN